MKENYLERTKHIIMTAKTSNRRGKSLFCRYKDGEVIPVDDWSDVTVKMTKNDKTVVSVLTLSNLSRQRCFIFNKIISLIFYKL